MKLITAVKRSTTARKIKMPMWVTDVGDGDGRGTTVTVAATGMSTDVLRSCLASMAATMKESAVRECEATVAASRWTAVKYIIVASNTTDAVVALRLNVVALRLNADESTVHPVLNRVLVLSYTSRAMPNAASKVLLISPVY